MATAAVRRAAEARAGAAVRAKRVFPGAAAESRAGAVASGRVYRKAAGQRRGALWVDIDAVATVVNAEARAGVPTAGGGAGLPLREVAGAAGAPLGAVVVAAPRAAVVAEVGPLA